MKNYSELTQLKTNSISKFTYSKFGFFIMQNKVIQDGKLALQYFRLIVVPINAFLSRFANSGCVWANVKFYGRNVFDEGIFHFKPKDFAKWMERLPRIANDS
jgi:hypothetical protein